MISSTIKPEERMQYTKKYMESLSESRYRKEVKFIVGMFKAMQANPKKIVDIGCGLGLQAKLLAEMGYSVIGIDNQPDLIARNRKVVKGVEFEVGDMRKLNLREKLDAALCLQNVLIYNTDVEQLRVALKNVNEALNPGGVFVFSINKENFKYEYYKKEYVRNYKKGNLFISRFTERKDSKNNMIRITTWLVMDNGKLGTWTINNKFGLFSLKQFKKELETAGFSGFVVKVNSDVGDPKLFIACRKTSV